MKELIRYLKVMLALAVSGLLAACHTAPPPRIVVLWHNFNDSQAEMLAAMTDAFNRQYRGPIQLVTEHQSQILAKLVAAPPASRPDLTIIWPEDLALYEEAGFLAAADAQPPLSRAARDDLLSMAAALYTHDGHLQALPLGLATYVLYYNADWLDDLGYDATRANLEDWRRAACATTEQGERVGVGILEQSSSMLALMVACESEIVTQQGQYQFSDMGGVAAGTILAALRADECGVFYHTPTQAIEQLSRNTIGMLIASSLQQPAIEQAVYEGRNFTLALDQLPGLLGPGHSLWYGPGLRNVAPEGPRREAAREVLLWFYSPEAQHQWSTLTHYVPVRRSLIAQQDVTELTPSQLRLYQLTLAADANETWQAWPPHANYTLCRAGLLRAFLRMEADKAPNVYLETAAQACNQPAPELEEIGGGP